MATTRARDYDGAEQAIGYVLMIGLGNHTNVGQLRQRFDVAKMYLAKPDNDFHVCVFVCVCFC